ARYGVPGRLKPHRAFCKQHKLEGMVLIPKAGFIKERPIRKQSLQHGGQAGSSEWSST
ncbi:unnamed protein product, partial [Heterosigma akashiwo]